MAGEVQCEYCKKSVASECVYTNHSCVHSRINSYNKKKKMKTKIDLLLGSIHNFEFIYSSEMTQDKP